MERKHAGEHAKLKKRLSFDFFKSSLLHQYIALMALIITGAGLGAFYIKTCGVGKSVLDGTGFFMQDILSQGAAAKGFLSLAVTAFFPFALLLCAAFLFGLCAIGIPFEVLIPIIHGMWLGASMASIDIRYGAKGLGICLLFIMPQALITSLAAMVASREGIRLSQKVGRAVFGGTVKNLTSYFHSYCYKYAVCFLLAVLSSIIEALSIIIFANIFFT